MDFTAAEVLASGLLLSFRIARKPALAQRVCRIAADDARARLLVEVALLLAARASVVCVLYIFGLQTLQVLLVFCTCPMWMVDVVQCSCGFDGRLRVGLLTEFE